MSAPPAFLAFDSASSAASAAVARGGHLLGSAAAPRSGSDDAPELLALIARALGDAGLELSEIAGVLALAGPGSFTGLRVACATALGLAQATGRPAAGVPTLEALALAAPPGSGTVLAAVDALRGEWFVQRFARGPGLEAVALDEPRRAPAGEEDLLAGVDLVAGWGAAAIGAAAARPVPLLDSPRLADAVACAASLGARRWNAALLVRPLYLRAAATTVRS